MNCQEFQEVLPHIIEDGGNREAEAHMHSCPGCTVLVEDLKYIAGQSRLLLPLHDPSPRVWHGIQQSLRHEGLIPEGRMSLMGHMAFPTQPKSWTPLGSVLALAAVIVMAVVLLNYHSPAILPVPETTAQNAVNVPLDGTDQQLIWQVAQQQPVIGAAFEASLKDVNTYIEDAKRVVDENPGDRAAQQRLMDAYDQKAMLYEMATVRSLQ